MISAYRPKAGVSLYPCRRARLTRTLPVALKLISPNLPVEVSSGLAKTIEVLPSATLKILIIKLKKSAGGTFPSGAFHLEFDGKEWGDGDMNSKLSDLGLKTGDEIAVCFEVKVNEM